MTVSADLKCNKCPHFYRVEGADLFALEPGELAATKYPCPKCGHSEATVWSVRADMNGQPISEYETAKNLPVFAQRMINGLRQATSQKWYEAAITFFSRALINRAVSIECQIAGFDGAQVHFEQRALYFMAEGFRCLGNAGHALQSAETLASDERLK